MKILARIVIPTLGLILAVILVADATALENLEIERAATPVAYRMNFHRIKRQLEYVDPSLQQPAQNLPTQQQNGNTGFNGQSFGQQPSGSNQFQSGNQFPGWINPNQGSSGLGNFNQNAQGVIRPQTTQRPLVNQIANQNTVSEAECIRNCPATNQWNPVCGTDNISYGNMNKLRCAQQCGRRE